MSDFTVSRRQVLTTAAAAAGAAVVAGSPAAAHTSHDTADPFPLGVASGDPTAFSVILWTRLARDLYADFPAAFDAPVKAANPLLNPHVKYFDGLKRGYLRCAVGRDAWRTDLRTVDSIETRESPVRTQASFAVAAGTSRIVAA